MKHIILMVALSLSLGISASAQIITNGSFEDAPCSFGDNWLFPGDLPAWIISTSTSYILINCSGDASHGMHYVDLLQTGSVTQDIPTSAGVLYRVTFDLSGVSFHSSDSVRSMRVTADGASAVDYERILPLGWPLNWEQRTYDFVASDSATELAFTSTTGFSNLTYYGPALDNVAATAIGGNVCHSNNGNAPFSTLNVSPRAFTAHLNHGDQIGACP